MRRGGRPGLPNRSTPLIVWAAGLVVALIVAWLVFRWLDPQELQEIGPVGAAFASPYPAGQVSVAIPSMKGAFASHEEPTA